jgi:hypothetical protein
MGRQFIGQILKDMGRLSPLDIDEILSEQAVSRRQFGDIAMSWGLCDAEHILEAWCVQMGDDREQVDILRTPVDIHALMCIPAQVARRLKVMPLRIIANELVVAAACILDPQEVGEMTIFAGRDIRLIKADPRQIDLAIERYYPRMVAA